MRDTLADWQAGDLVIVTELIVSELVSNGILHARSPLTLRLDSGDDGILVEVVDDSPIQPSRRHYDAEATTGRGLSLVATLTNGDWGSRPTGAGKLVWARVSPDSSDLPDVAG